MPMISPHSLPQGDSVDWETQDVSHVIVERCAVSRNYFSGFTLWPFTGGAFRFQVAPPDMHSKPSRVSAICLHPHSISRPAIAAKAVIEGKTRGLCGERKLRRTGKERPLRSPVRLLCNSAPSSATRSMHGDIYLYVSISPPAPAFWRMRQLSNFYDLFPQSLGYFQLATP